MTFTELPARHDHRPPVAGIAALALLTIGILIYTRTPRWWQAALVVLALAGAYALFKWHRGRTTVTLNGDKIAVRSPARSKEVRGADIIEVGEMPNGRSPDHLLRTADGTKLYVPTSEVRRGHSALFRWLATNAPQAKLDKRSQRTRRVLIDRGQIDSPEVMDKGLPTIE